jgi:hypothetical protein
MITADSTINASSRLTADGRALRATTTGHVIAERRIWRALRTLRTWLISA